MAEIPERIKAQRSVGRRHAGIAGALGPGSVKAASLRPGGVAWAVRHLRLPRADAEAGRIDGCGPGPGGAGDAVATDQAVTKT